MSERAGLVFKVFVYQEGVAAIQQDIKYAAQAPQVCWGPMGTL